MLLRNGHGSGHCLPRSQLQLATRLTLARSFTLRRTWAGFTKRHPRVKTARRHSQRCRASESSQSSTLRCARRLLCSKIHRIPIIHTDCDTCREVAVELAVEEGDTLESLSAESGFSQAKLKAANGGELQANTEHPSCGSRLFCCSSTALTASRQCPRCALISISRSQTVFASVYLCSSVCLHQCIPIQQLS